MIRGFSTMLRTLKQDGSAEVQELGMENEFQNIIFKPLSVEW